MRLAFKNKYSFGYSLKEVEITLNLAAIESACKELNIELWQMPDYARKNAFDYMTELLYAGYIIACKDRYKKPKWSKINAIFWNEQMSITARDEFTEKINVFISGTNNPTKSKKKVTLKKAG
jgi:hypothetical protein